jgi:hypothetical protein
LSAGSSHRERNSRLTTTPWPPTVHLHKANLLTRKTVVKYCKIRNTSGHNIYLLPAELILDIIDLLPPEAFINFAFANYPFLHASGLAPALSRVRINYIQDKTRIPALFPLFRIPAEITLEIMHHLKPIDLMRFVMANYQDLARQGITPPLTEDTLRQLRLALG